MRADSLRSVAPKKSLGIDETDGVVVVGGCEADAEVFGVVLGGRAGKGAFGGSQQ